VTETRVAPPLPRIRDLRRTGAILLLAIGASFATVASAGQGVWTSGGPYGGNVSALAVDPSTPSTLYAGMSSVTVQGSGGLFKSTDSGGTWVSANVGLGGLDVRGLFIDPATPSTLYAVARGVFKSTDSGGTWVPIDAGLTVSVVWTLAINPSTPSNLYAGTSDGVFKSTDSGSTWAAVNAGLASVAVWSLAINPSTPTTVYAGTSSGVFKSTDSGGTWAAVNTGLTELHSYSLAINPSSPATLYAGTMGGGVFKSTDSGGTWFAVNTGLTDLRVSSLAINSSTPSTLYAVMSNGVFKSTDSGGTWVAASTGLPPQLVSTLAINPLTPSTLYAGTGGLGIFKSTDSGGIWTATGLRNQWISALTINPSVPSTLYAGTGFGGSVGVLKSTDSGATWAPANTGLTHPWVSALAIDPVTPSTLYAGTLFVVVAAYGALCKSTDSGATWAPTNTGLPNQPVTALAINPSSPSTLYAGTDGGGVFKSIDSGGTWAAVNAGLPNPNVRALVIDPVTASTLYAVSAPSPPQGTVGFVFGEVFKSTDSGVTWAAANTALPNLSVSALVINPAIPTTLYAGTNGHGVFKSTDSGATWAAANAGLLNRNVTALAIHPSTPTTLYAGTNGGVFKSTDSGGTWAAINGELPSLAITVLALDPTGASTLYAGLAVNSVWQLTSPPDGTRRIEDLVPIVLDVTGLARYTSELQLTNLGASPTTVRLSYTGSIGSGAGNVLETIPSGQQVVYPDAISYLRVRGVPIPASGSQGGTLFLSAPAAGVHATVRTGSDTVTPQPIGRAGLAYTGTDPAASSLDPKIVYGLRASGADRSNLAVYNMGADPVSLTVTLVSGDDGRSFDVTAGVPLVLPAYGWYQYSGVLNAADFSSGYAIVSGSGPFGAYGVVNDQITNDGSFFPGVSTTPSGAKLTVPVLVETNAFESEMILANPGIQTAGIPPAVTFTLRYVESLSPANGAGGTTTVDVAGGRQKIIPNAIDFLRSKGVSIGARGEAGYAGSLQVQASGGFPVNVFAGARTSSLSPAGGEFGVFYQAIDSSQEFSALAYVLGLKADVNNRSNVAAIHTGAEGSGPITLELQVLDGSEGGKAVGPPLSVTLSPGQWAQPPGFFASGGVPNGYVRIRRTAGTAPWYAYGVINDGGQPGQRTGDGSYVAGVQP
jgi:photosystem II stability/assembly factor-like uncharacterized protein